MIRADNVISREPNKSEIVVLLVTFSMSLATVAVATMAILLAMTPG